MKSRQRAEKLGFSLRITGLAVVFGSLVAVSLQAQQVGEAIALEGNAQVQTARGDLNPLYLTDPVEQRDKLLTQINSQLDILLRSAHKFMMGQESTVTVESSGDNSTLLLEDGIVSILTSGRANSSVVIRNDRSGGQGRGRRTGFIVNCDPGPPATCLFVGLYNQTEVISLSFPNQSPVQLGRQQFTRVTAGFPPLPNPPERLDDQTFQQLIAATTVIGTGARSDQLAATDPAANQWPGPSALLEILNSKIPSGFGLDPKWKLQLSIPDQPPLEFEPLPPPPERPQP